MCPVSPQGPAGRWHCASLLSFHLLSQCLYLSLCLCLSFSSFLSCSIFLPSLSPMCPGSMSLASISFSVCLCFSAHISETLRSFPSLLSPSSAGSPRLFPQGLPLSPSPRGAPSLSFRSLSKLAQPWPAGSSVAARPLLVPEFRCWSLCR